jgi:hypothetical protein
LRSPFVGHRADLERATPICNAVLHWIELRKAVKALPGADTPIEILRDCAERIVGLEREVLKARAETVSDLAHMVIMLEIWLKDGAAAGVEILPEQFALLAKVRHLACFIGVDAHSDVKWAERPPSCV